MRTHLNQECAHELYFEFEVRVPVEEVWKVLTTEAGLRSFFSPHVEAEFYPGGKFLILFDLEAPEGQRGSEGMHILAMEENRFLSFTWNSPPVIQSLRDQMTTVLVHLEPIDKGTRIIFRNIGYGYSKEWQKSRAYFENAWGNIVLPRLKHALEKGPYDWVSRPKLPEMDYK